MIIKVCKVDKETFNEIMRELNSKEIEYSKDFSNGRLKALNIKDDQVCYWTRRIESMSYNPYLSLKFLS